MRSTGARWRNEGRPAISMPCPRRGRSPPGDQRSLMECAGGNATRLGSGGAYQRPAGAAGNEPQRRGRPLVAHRLEVVVGDRAHVAAAREAVPPTVRLHVLRLGLLHALDALEVDPLALEHPALHRRAETVVADSTGG